MRAFDPPAKGASNIVGRCTGLVSVGAESRCVLFVRKVVPCITGIAEKEPRVHGEKPGFRI